MSSSVSSLRLEVLGSNGNIGGRLCRKDGACMGAGKLLSNSGHRDPHVVLKDTGKILVSSDP